MWRKVCELGQLREITECLLQHVDPKMGMSIEMMNGQHFEVNWLEDRFWTAYRNKTVRQVAATLRPSALRRSTSTSSSWSRKSTSCRTKNT